MQPPQLNGVEKPADAIARGPHVYDPATRKYKEVQQTFSEYPKAMWQHETRKYKEAQSRDEEMELKSAGWQAKPFPEIVAKPKETVVAPSANLAEIILQQQQAMNKMQEQLEQLQAQQPSSTQAIPKVPKCGPGRPPKPEEAPVGA